MSHDTPSDHAAIAAAATTSPGATPNFGLAWDLSTGQWMDATEFRQFARAQMPLTQTAATQQAQRMQMERLREIELQKVRNFQQYGVFMADADFSNAGGQGGFGHDLQTGFRMAKNKARQTLDVITNAPVQGIPVLGSWLSAAGIGDPQEGLPKNAYAKYTKMGGLLTRAEFDELDEDTKWYLLEHTKSSETWRNIAETPAIAAGLLAAERYIYRPAIAFTEIMLDPDHAEWNALFSDRHWAQAWKEAQGESLGNALIDGIFESAGWADDDTLTRWKRDNPWYQMSSVGAEFALAWYADPLVVGGKALGGAARLKKNELPIRADSRQSIAIRQALQGQQVTAVRNPVTKQYVNFRAARIDDAKKQVEDYIRAGATVADLTRMPMFQSRGRVVDGGLAANTLHYAVTKQDELNRLINSPRVRDGLEGEMPEQLDILDLTWRLYFGDAQAWAMFNKLEQVAPDELLEIAPGAGELIDRVKSLRTRHETLESEIESLLADKVKWEVPGEEPSMFHRWETESDLTVKQAQLKDSTDALSRYEGYKEFLEDLNTSTPHLTRVSKPGHKRFSQARSRTDEVETRRIFAPNFYGRGHSFTKIPRALFVKRANTAELHDVDSTVTSINRQFDQMAHLFHYAPEGVRDDYIQRAITAKDEYDRYRILYELEEKHFVAAAAQRFEVDEEVVRTILHRVNDERNKTMQGILRGDDSRFGSAASLGERIRKGDESIQLVSRNDDEGTVRIRVMHGREIDEYELPREALFERKGPQDLTELPNYYNPLDHRAMYYTLKHDKAMLDTLNKGYLTRGSAALGEASNWAGTNFNKLWKPYQLFRAAWPMRVLMDEGMRAMAILGPMYWLKNDGMEALLKTVPNTAKYAADRRTRKRQGGIGTSMAGPTVPKRANSNVFQRDHQIRTTAPVLPEVLFPKINPERAAKIDTHTRQWFDWNWRLSASGQWLNKVNDVLMDESSTSLQVKLAQHGLQQRNAAVRGDEPDHPILKIARAWKDRSIRIEPTIPGRRTEQGQPLGKHIHEGPHVFDATNGQRIRSGYVVPLMDRSTGFDLTRRDMSWDQSLELVKWYQNNAELLSRQGMRIVATPEGELYVGRVFRSNEHRKARDFAEYVSEKYEDTALWNLNKPGHFEKVEDVTDLSPSMVLSFREFSSEEVLERTEGKAPIEGEPEVYHGSDNTLPDPLLPRDDVPAFQGNMVGKGLYTTVSRETAEQYGSRNLYTIRGSKSGKRYKVFDLDEVITPTELDRMIEFFNAHRGDAGVDLGAEYEGALRAAVGNMPQFLLTYRNPAGSTWANLYESIGNPRWQRAFHRYLEEVHGAGALTHKGGTTHTHPHQVYVWLHPEDLDVKPLYAGTGKYQPLVHWLAHPTSVENPIPESQIIRKGKMNPMLRELRTVERQLANYERKPGVSKFRDPEYNAMVQREQELMSALGLEYRHNVGKPSADSPIIFEGEGNALIPERYVVKEAGRFERLVDEAKAEDVQRDVDAANRGELRAREREALDVENLDDFDFKLDSPYEWLMRKLRERAEQGLGYKRVRSSDGKEVVVESAYNGHRGQLFRALASSNGVLDVLSEGHGSGSSYYRRRSEGWRAYEPPVFTDAAVNNPRSSDHKKAVRYFQVYADTVNDHFGHSPIAQKISKGWDNDRIIDWLDETPEGQRVRDTIKPDFMNTAQWVDEYQEKFFYAVPNPMLRRLLGKGRLAPSDFRKHVPDEDLPTIYGPDFEVLDRRRSAGELLNDFADKVYHALGTVPIDHLSRHPYAKAMYDVKMKELVGSTDSKFLTQEAIEHFQELSRRHAMNEVRRTLYTLLDVTNFTDALRFIAPFWGAQYEAITKWGRIIANRPETVARFFAGQRAVYENFVVWDEEGQEVRTPFRSGGLHNFGIYQPEDRVIMPLPGFIANRFPGLKEFAKVGIPIGSANTVLQGEMPLLPGLGPLVTVPADLFLKAVDDTYGVENSEDLIYKWLFPVGRPRSSGSFGRIMEQISPGWSRRMQQAGGSQNNTARFNMMMQVGREMRLRAEREGKPLPTDAEIAAAADFMWAVRGIASFVAPAQVQFLPKHQYWVDAYHRMEKEYGFEAQDKFLEKYGEEAAAYAISSSNSLGIPATSKGMVEWEGNKTLIGKYPEWAKAIISPEAWMDDFNPDAYGQQFNIPVRPGSTERLRSVVDVQDRLETQPEVLLGWREYRKLAAAVEAELANNGWTSLQQKDAEGLRLYKREMIAAIKQKYPAWGAEYDDHGNTINHRVAQLYEPDFQRFLERNQQRPDLRGVSTYLSLRAQTVMELERWASQGGSPSLQSEQNGALRGWFYNQVGQLILDNPAFAEFYTRYLEGDTLETAGGGY